jgi:hypothetical protein
MAGEDTNRLIWSVVGGLVGLAAAGFVLGWGSALVHILAVIVVMLVLYQWLKGRQPGR